MQHHSSYKYFKIPEKEFDYIIIGSGISGMCSGAILAKEGKKVLILEQHYTPGGFTHSFKRHDLEWDTGVHYLGEVGNKESGIRKVFDYICDQPIEWLDMGDTYDTFFYGKEKYEFKKGKEATIESLSAKFPKQRHLIEKYFALLGKLDLPVGLFYGSKLLPKFLDNLIGPLMRRPYLKFCLRTTDEILKDLGIEGKLKEVLCSQCGDYGLPPDESSFAISSMVTNHYINGAYYPKGGSKVIFNSIAPTVTKNKGQILIKAEVKKILTNNGKTIGVEMADGRIIKSQKVISSCGYENTFHKLLGINHNFVNSSAPMKSSHTYYSLYVGLDGCAENLELPKSNYWIYLEEGTHSANLNSYMNGTLNKFPVVYISFAGAKDPESTKEKNKSTLEIIAPARFADFDQWAHTGWKKRGDDYEAFKNEISSRLLNVLYEYVPQLKGKVIFHELSTPLSTKHFTGYQKGEMYGLSHSPERFKNNLLRPATPIKNLYLTGQDIITCGIGGGIMAGALTASSALNSPMLLPRIQNSGKQNSMKKSA